MYNFGDDNINFINVPWGGIRNSSLDHFFISDPSNNYALEAGLYGQTPVIQTSSTGGWVAWSDNALGSSASIGMAHPTATSTNGNVFRYGDAGDLTNPNNLRDYHVFEMIRFPSQEQLSFGTALSFRFYYVLGENVDSVKSTIVEHGLVSASFDSDFTPQKLDVDSVAYHIHSNGSTLTTSINEEGLMLQVTPYLNSYPLFLLSSAGEQFISSDPYHYSPVAYDGTTENIKLLGFLDNQSRVAVRYDTICSGESYTFPDGSLQVLVMENQTHLSTINSVQADWDSIVFTHLSVVDLDLDVIQTGDNLESVATGVEYQWLNCQDNYAEILSADGQNFTPVGSGIYSVEVSDGECIDTSACVTVNLVGLISNDLSRTITCYPNPTSGNLTINLGTQFSEVRLKLLDPLGKLVLEEHCSDRQWIEFYVPGAAGMYTAQLVLDDGKAIQFKFVKE